MNNTQIARAVHAAIREVQHAEDRTVWSPWDDCDEGFREQQVSLVAELIDNPDLDLESVPYLELRAVIVSVLYQDPEPTTVVDELGWDQDDDD